MKVGDLTTLVTLGWTKVYRVKYENKVGIITRINGHLSPTKHWVVVSFGEEEIKVSEDRIRLVEEKA